MTARILQLSSLIILFVNFKEIQCFHSLNGVRYSTVSSSSSSFSYQHGTKTKTMLWKNENNLDDVGQKRKEKLLFVDETKVSITSLKKQKEKKNDVQKMIQSSLVGLFLTFSVFVSSSFAASSDPNGIALCLFKKCPAPLAKCILNPKCLGNVICINTCTGKPDEIGCQIKCGDFFENDVIGEFNKCAVSDLKCVPQVQDDGSYPVPPDSALVKKFNTNLFTGRWYISAGKNELFDTFPCQVHFFESTKPGTFVGKLNWRIEEPDGEFLSRDALQRFVQDEKNPALLLNHDNEFLHYQDDWYIIDYAEDNNPDKIPPFAAVYYRGSNDAWDGYGGMVIYTRAASFPPELHDRIAKAVAKVNFDFDKDFALVDNTCKELNKGEALLLREKFVGNVALQTEKQLAQQAVRARQNAVNGAKAQRLFIEGEITGVEDAFENIGKATADFEKEIERDIVSVEKVIEKDIVGVEKEVENDVKKILGR